MPICSGIYIVPANRWCIERTVWLIAGVDLCGAPALAAPVNPHWVLLIVASAAASVIAFLTGVCLGIRRMPRAPRPALVVLTLQAGSALAAIAAVVFLT
jgi:hypothetical protein